MLEIVSLAIETSCPAGGAAIGVGEHLVEAVEFDASARHATQLITQLKQLLSRHNYKPADLGEVYISAGPGSFTGVRIGVTVGRTLGQMLPQLRLVAVSSARAVAYNALGLHWEHLAVVLDAKETSVYVQLFGREGSRIVPRSQGEFIEASKFVASAPRPLTLIGQGLDYLPISGEGITIPCPGEAAMHLPSPRGVWHVGYELARSGQFTPYQQLLPIYSRKPEAVRLWEAKR